MAIDKDAAVGVVSLAETWIEILWRIHTSQKIDVVSLAETWIEIFVDMLFRGQTQSSPSRRCGLKLGSFFIFHQDVRAVSLVETWLEILM